MDAYRRKFKLDVTDDLQQTRVLIRRADETIDRLSHDEELPFRTIELVAKTQKKLAELQARERELEEKLERIEAGVFDDELQEERKDNAEAAREKALLTKQKKAATATRKAPPVPGQKHERFRFVTEREMSIGCARYHRSCAKFPDKLAEKLDKLPNNHGIIFNGIHFYGMRPPVKPYDTLVMQDKQGDNFYVHYSTPTERATFLKKGYGRQTKEVFVEQGTRRRIPTGLSPRHKK
jgi:hypothetical protein